MQIAEYLATKTGKSVHDIGSLISNAPRMYKVYRIPKRTGGYRVIAQPSKAIKSLQRYTVELLRDSLPIHSCAMAYQKGKDIKLNAQVHCKNEYILKMDFEDFFNSINPELFKKCLKLDRLNFSESDINFLIKLLFWNPSKRKNGKLILSVGAPSSPMISNYIMYRFDCAIEKYCEQENITYSRYADDMTFSTLKKDQLFIIPDIVQKTLKQNSYKRISIKLSKTVFSSKAHNRHVTGVTLNNNGEISIGRARKRMLASLIFQAIREELDNDELLSLKGQLGQAFYIDSKFKASMHKKYGIGIINKIIGGNSEKA